MVAIEPDHPEAPLGQLLTLRARHAMSFTHFEERHYTKFCNNLSKIVQNVKDHDPEEYVEGGLWMTDERGDSPRMEKRECFVNAFASKDLKRIGEIGFNAGHSSVMLLSFLPSATIMSFDICKHSYTLLAHEYVQHIFPNRHELVCGDSLNTLPDLFHYANGQNQTGNK